MLARDLREAGDYVGSLELLREAHANYVANLGEDDIGTLLTAQSLAASLRKAGHLEEAYQRTLDASERYETRYETRKASGHPDALACQLNLAACQAALGDTATATATARAVHGVYEESLGQKHPFTLAVTSNMAGYLRAAGQAGEALLLAESTLRKLREKLGDDHPYPLSCALNMANCLHDLGQFNTAGDLLRETITRQRKTLGDSHPDTLIAQANLAIVTRALRQKDEADRLRQGIKAAMARSPLGEDHPVVRALENWTLVDIELEPQPT
jgi:tetratricopeptide (TPR) repeat protein